MLEDMQVRNLSPHTQQSYVLRVSQFARHFGKSPEQLGFRGDSGISGGLDQREKARPEVDQHRLLRPSISLHDHLKEELARRGRDPRAEGATDGARGASAQRRSSIFSPVSPSLLVSKPTRPPAILRVLTRRTGGGKYEPADMRFQTL